MKRLYYTDEAKKWEEAFPLGNGHMGGMFFCGRGLDKIGLSEDTIWSGTAFDKCDKHDIHEYDNARRLINEGKYDAAHDEVYKTMYGRCPQTFLTAGNLFVDMQGQRRATVDRDEVSKSGNFMQGEYTRTLDLETAVMDCGYEFDGIRVKKQAFISNPDSVLVYKINLNNKADFNIYLSCPIRHTAQTSRDEILLKGVCPAIANKDLGNVVSYGDNTIRFAERVRVVTDGECYDSGAALYIKCASEIIIYAAIATSFDGYCQKPGKEYINKSKDIIENARKIGYDELLKRHIRDYSELFSRTDIRIGADNGKPTDERIKSPENDSNLAELIFDYGKYLLIASSRTGTEPANLQGVWNDTMIPPFHSSYTTNINLQMNYWAADACCLYECAEPLYRFIREMSESGHSLSEKGWCLWHCTDIWRYPYETLKLVINAFWPMGGVWLVRHLWEHYLHTNDVEFLEKNIDIFKGACEFLKEWIIEDENGECITCPSTSPENAFMFNGKRCGTAKASAMDLSLCKELFGNTAKALEILGQDGSEYKVIEKKIKDLSIGKDGRLLEWNEELCEEDAGHRHLSHLYGIYPSNIIREGSKLYDAARKSLDVRVENGSGYTGWSNAWVLNLYARFKDGESAYNRILSFFKNSVYPNMFDKHPPFQIDGNFGMCAGIIEMLVQSHTEYCELIPALPKEWKSGSVRGIRVRGGYTVNFEWKDGEIVSKCVTDANGEEVEFAGSRFRI